MSIALHVLSRHIVLLTFISWRYQKTADCALVCDEAHLDQTASLLINNGSGEWELWESEQDL